MSRVHIYICRHVLTGELCKSHDALSLLRAIRSSWSLLRGYNRRNEQHVAVTVMEGRRQGCSTENQQTATQRCIERQGIR